MRLATLAVPFVLFIGVAACGDDDATPEADSGEASVEIASPSDGDTVESPVIVTMEAAGVTIEPAGEVNDGAGHFHLMVDVGCVDPGEVIPADASHNHFGGGQTEATLELDPGEHTICLQVGDGLHTALDITDTITVTVE